MNTLEILENGRNFAIGAIQRAQDFFMSDTFKNAVNTGVDFGIRLALPDIIEEQTIEIKNSIVEGGFGAGFETLNNKLNEFKSSVQGIINGEFNSIEEMKLATKNKGIIKTVSSGLSKGIDIAIQTGLLDKKSAKLLKSTKSTMLNEFKNSLQSKFEKEIAKLEKLNKYNERWHKAYDNRDFEKMEKYYNKIEEIYPHTVKFEKTIEDTKNILTLHNWIKENNSFDFVVGTDDALIKLE